MNLKRRAVIFVSTGFYLGKIPFAPGTFGSLPGLFLCYIASLLNFFSAAAFILFFILAAVLISNEAEKIFKKKDPGCIVVDEMAGMGVALLGLPFNRQTAFAGFVLFRLFDIFKPFPVKTFEKRIPGGAGIVMDDVVAGIFVNIILRFAFS